MNALVSSSPFPRAHPPRSNPFLRSSDAAPLPCITPSMVTWVIVVSFMIAVPPPRRRHRAGGLTGATNTAAPIRQFFGVGGGGASGGLVDDAGGVERGDVLHGLGRALQQREGQERAGALTEA